jgi:hypothetical protein
MVQEGEFADDKCILWYLDSDVLAGARAAPFPCPLWRIRGANGDSDTGDHPWLFAPKSVIISYGMGRSTPK